MVSVSKNDKLIIQNIILNANVKINKKVNEIILNMKVFFGFDVETSIKSLKCLLTKNVKNVIMKSLYSKNYYQGKIFPNSQKN